MLTKLCDSANANQHTDIILLIISVTAIVNPVLVDSSDEDVVSEGGVQDVKAVSHQVSSLTT